MENEENVKPEESTESASSELFSCLYQAMNDLRKAKNIAFTNDKLAGNVGVIRSVEQITGWITQNLIIKKIK